MLVNIFQFQEIHKKLNVLSYLYLYYIHLILVKYNYEYYIVQLFEYNLKFTFKKFH